MSDQRFWQPCREGHERCAVDGVECECEARSRTTRGYRSDAEWMATYLTGRLPDHNTMTPDEIAEYERQLQEIIEGVAAGIGKP